MEYAARLPRIPSRRTMLAPVVALLAGAGVATGAYALIDDNDVATQASKVIVVEQPAAGMTDIPGKNEATTAAAIAGATSATDIRGKDEAATAAGISQSNGVEFDAAAEQRSDPHGPAAALWSR